MAAVILNILLINKEIGKMRDKTLLKIQFKEIKLKIKKGENKIFLLLF